MGMHRWGCTGRTAWLRPVATPSRVPVPATAPAPALRVEMMNSIEASEDLLEELTASVLPVRSRTRRFLGYHSNGQTGLLTVRMCT